MFLIEQIDNIIQLAALLVLTVLAFYKGMTTRKRIWALLCMFYGVAALGNLYWFLHMIIYSETPYYDFIPDFCWISAFMFLILLLLNIRDREWDWKRHKFLWLIPVFTVGMAVFYMQWGEHLTNIVYAVFMTVLIFCSLEGYLHTEKKTGKHDLYLISMLFCLAEYALWTSSCLPWEFPVFDPYYAFDILLTLIYVFFYPAAGKAAHDELY